MCNRNQTNFSDLLPYKGIGTPSGRFSWWSQLLFLFFSKSYREGLKRITPAVWMVCVQSEESHLRWCGLQRFFRLLSEQRVGAVKQRTTSLQADRGSDSTFQMQDRTRRILVRGSATPPVCETAICFLFLPLFSWLFSSSCMPLLPFLALSSMFKRKKTASRLQDKSHLVNPLPHLL